MTKIAIPISDEELVMLAKVAKQNLRHPRDQARYILRSALLGEQSQESKNPSTVSLPDRTVNGFVISQP